MPESMQDFLPALSSRWLVIDVRAHVPCSGPLQSPLLSECGSDLVASTIPHQLLLLVLRCHNLVAWPCHISTATFDGDGVALAVVVERPLFVMQRDSPSVSYQVGVTVLHGDIFTTVTIISFSCAHRTQYTSCL